MNQPLAMDNNECVAATLESLVSSTDSAWSSSLHIAPLVLSSNHSSTRSSGIFNSGHPVNMADDFDDDDEDDNDDEFYNSPSTNCNRSDKSLASKGLSKSGVLKGVAQSVVTLPFDIFDKAEYLTMESLRRQYWDGFLQSPYWLKFKHFLWYQDRRVLPADFFVMRVLGRGGFGLVNGASYCNRFGALLFECQVCA